VAKATGVKKRTYKETGQALVAKKQKKLGTFLQRMSEKEALKMWSDWLRKSRLPVEVR